MDAQAGDNSNRPPNRHSHSDHFSCKRSLKELLHTKDDDSGYIEGKVFMMWPPRNRLYRINLEVSEDSALYRFELEVPYGDGISFRPHELICFALKGVKVDPRKDSSSPYYFPIVLRYPDGVVLKYLTGANAGKVIDTLAGSTDEWYNPGVVHTVSDAVTIDASEMRHGLVPTVTHLPMPAPPQRDGTCRGAGIRVEQAPSPSFTTTDGAAAAQLTRPVQQSGTGRSGRSNSRVRKKRKSQKAQVSMLSNQPTGDTNEPRLNSTTPSHQQLHFATNSSLTSASGNHPKLDQTSGHVDDESSVLEDNEPSRKINCSNTVSVSAEATVHALQLKAGFHTQRGDTFTALSDLQKGHSMINVIGIVASVNPERKTSTNEWSRSFTIIDPSSVDSSQQGLRVNCFQKKYLEWLPQVQENDIVILRKLKIVEYNDTVSATGYCDKLRWAVYDPLNHSVRPPNRGNAPEKESTDDGLGYEFSPYWEPFQDSAELEYCRRVREWWQTMCGSEGQKVHMVMCSRRPPKQHLLISEASPDHPPDGFFNCTVEVLHKLDNRGGATTICVTDYTANSLVCPTQATWCPPELSSHVLQCNMWDRAKEIAEIMSPGEYWYLYNVRARWNPSHYMEGTMQLAEKVSQLDETKLEIHPHLKTLLERKKQFGLNPSSPATGSTSSRSFPHMLIQDVVTSTSFLTCIVELLYVDPNPRDGNFIYVTDYTYNPGLPAAVSSADWARNLERRVVKIRLDDAQAKISSSLKSGGIYTIRNLRIKRSSMSNDVYGCLGGEDTLIVSLHDSSSYQAETLQRNKEKWKREIMLNTPIMSHGEPAEPASRPSTASDDTTLREVLTRPAPDMFRILARVVDFFPFSLEDACVLRCTKCKSSPSPAFKRCPRCDDMMETHSKWFYCLYVLLQDEKGDEVIVSLSGNECTPLQDVEPTDFHCDFAAFRKFLGRLDPILGNLRDVHAAWSENEQKAIVSPLMMFTLESWNVGNERGYGLLDWTSS